MTVLPANRIREGDGDPRHGTANGYTNHKCRCDKCRAAWAAYMKPYVTAHNRRMGIRPIEEWNKVRPKAAHGTESKYRGGCRCEPCRMASVAARRKRRHANPEATRQYDNQYRFLTYYERRAA